MYEKIGAVLIARNFIIFNQSGRFIINFRKQDRIRKLQPIKDTFVCGILLAESRAIYWFSLICNCICNRIAKLQTATSFDQFK